MRSLLLIFLPVFILLGCQKDIEFELKEADPKMVVEATIENGMPPIVILTRTVGYFSTISPQILSESFVHGAEIKISNGSKNHLLKEYSIPLGLGYSYYYYSIDSSNLSTAFIGELDKKYSLTIFSSGEEYSAITRIPRITKVIDSLWWKKVPSDTSNTKAIVMVRETDPPGYGDYVRYWTKRNSESFYPGLASVYDDLIVDGSTYDLAVEPGINRNEGYNEDKRAFKKGDTVSLKISNIDRATFDFWRTMEYTYTSVGNPFSAPTKVQSNISNGALGYFGGYASQVRTIIIPL